MLTLLVDAVAVVAVGYFVLRHGRDRLIRGVKPAQGLRIGALVPLGLQAAVFLLFGVGEMAAGEPGGAGHLLQLAVIVLLAALAWLRPLQGGIALFACGVLSAIAPLISITASGPLPESAVLSSGVLILAVPQIVSGALFFAAGMLAQRAPSPEGT
jgi:hypothetical protein